MNKGNRTKRIDITPGTTNGPAWSNYDSRPDALSNYQDYLAMVQERNRCLKRLQTKDPKQIEMERREQGFTLYVNGANVNLPTGQDVVVVKSVPKQRKRAKTAEKNRTAGKNLVSDAEFYDSQNRTIKTAPERPRRRKWQMRSVEIKTNSGESVRIKPPVILTGKYSDDFEKEALSGDDDDEGDDDDDDDDDNGDDENNVSGSDDFDDQARHSSDGDKILEKNSRDDIERVSLTIRDVKKLRRSLELSSSIHESLQGAVSVSKSSLMEESIEEDFYNPLGSVSDSHLVVGNTKNSLDHQCEQILKPNDIIVLELASNKTPFKSDKQLTAAKRKTSNSTESLSSERRTPRGSGGSRTPREERAKERLSTEDMRVQKSKEILLRPVSDAGATKSKASSPTVMASKSSDHRMDSSEDSSATETSNISHEGKSSSSKSCSNQEILADRISLTDVNDDDDDDDDDDGDNLQPSSSSSAAKSLSSCLLPSDLQLELGGGSINELVGKVLQLEPNVQQQLLKALKDIEQGVNISLKSAWNQSTFNDSSLLKTEEMLTTDNNTREIKSANKIKIHICIFSNWGHPCRVGLTGIELFDLDRRRIEIQSRDVEIQGANNVSGDLMALFNGKYKTVKERNMWSCDLQSLNPIRITITLKNHDTGDTNLGISKLKIWNFNKNAGQLNKGARHIKILVDGDVAFDGDLDKGCGNHVFDYGKMIYLGSKSGVGSESPRSDLATTSNKNSKIDPSNSDWLCLHDLDKAIVQDKMSAGSQASETDISKKSQKFSEFEDNQSNYSKGSKSDGHLCDESWIQDNSDLLAKEINDVLSLKDSPFQLSEEPISCKQDFKNHSLRLSSDLSSILGNQSDDDSISIFQKIQEITKKQKKEPPSWINDNGITLGNHDQSGQDGVLENEWPNLELEDILENRDLPSRNSNKDWKSSEYFSKQILNDGQKNQEKEDWVDSPVRNRENARAKWNLKREKSLEESWLSLTLFNRFQKGRLSIDLEGDELNEYLSSPKVKQEATIFEESTDDSRDTFAIPELPFGQELVISIVSTWGDKHYVGLTGIEIFTDTGEPAPISKISAEPSDINVLPEYSGDPRVVTNLVDGINRTRDDTHMWLAPFTSGQKHLVIITFHTAVRISLLRIWNYNKSRIHSSRGAKDIEVSLDNRLIFVGEIARSSGGIVGGSEAFGDTILFTTDEDILELVSHYDQTFEVDIEDEDPSRDMVERPKTADKGDERSRPFTSASNLLKKHDETPIEKRELVSDAVHDQMLKGRFLQLNFTATWGDIHYLGLTGIEVLGKDCESIPVTMDMIDANRRDLHILPGYEADDRTLDKLIDGVNVTSVDEHMWLIPFTEAENHYVQFNFSQPTAITGLRVWNYNKSAEDTYRGARIMHASLDGRCISPPEGFLIRKGPGNCFFNFAQEISFVRNRTTKASNERRTDLVLPLSDESMEEYEVIQKPCGFIYQLQLLSSWGDPYYLGLNGIEFYDADGLKIDLTANNVAAYPDSVNVLEGIENDVRTPDKLVDGVNDSQDGRHMWLAPILPNILNRVYIIFDSPVELSMVKIWNYSKMPSRGVKDIAMLIDDLLVYNGTLDMVPVRATGILPTVSGPQRYHTILFTNNKAIVQEIKHTVIKNQALEQEVQLTNDHKVVAANKKCLTKPVDQALRPTTSVPAHQRKPNRHR